MNREVRTVRPFNVPPDFQWALESVRFRMGTQTCLPDSKVVVGANEEYLRTRPELLWAETEEEFTAFEDKLNQGITTIGLDPKAVGIVATSYTAYLKITDFLLIHSLADLDSLPRFNVFDNPRPDALQASTHGSVVAVNIALLRDQPPKALTPWRKGTWLAKTCFRIETDTISEMFRPSPLDDAARDRFGLRRYTSRYFSIGDHDPFATYEETEPPELYVDADLLALIDRDAASPMAKALQTLLVADFIAGVVTACAARPDDLYDATWDNTKDSILGRIIALIAGPQASAATRETLLATTRNDPAKLIALAEDAIGLRKALLNSLSEDA